MKKMMYGFFGLLALVIVWAVVTAPTPPTEDEIKTASKQYMEYTSQYLKREDNGRTIWELNTQKSILDLTTQNTEFFGIAIKFYTADGKTINVQAAHGYLIDSEKKITLDQGTKVVSSDGIILTSKELVWEDKKGLLSAIGEAKLEKEDMIVEAERIEGFDGFEEFCATGKVHLIKRGAN